MSPTPPIATPDHTASFVGRAAELERLHAALAQTAAGSGRVVMLADEVGIGKTRCREREHADARQAWETLCAEGFDPQHVIQTEAMHEVVE